MSLSDDDSPWSLETLRIYLESKIEGINNLMHQRFLDQDKAVQAALLSAERAVAAALTAANDAVAKAEAAQEKRLDAVNEFRAQLSDQTATFIPRVEAEQRIETNAEKIDALATRIDRTEGKSSGLSAAWGFLIAAVGLVSSVIIVLVRLRG